ncbi:MAG: Crp/Fnr family transcriptional regulator [Phenylobacterium sp.]|uniref:Crp/Fnr family transcriptional regulator n=1 Tax=Phenylobacterium sp. TaxID=1871053 RepID=UPI00391C97EB
MLLDLHARLRAVGLVEGETVPFPLTQETLADTLGLSIVHMNRTLQQLRRAGLIRCRAGRLALEDRRALEQIAGFDVGSHAGRSSAVTPRAASAPG